MKIFIFYFFLNNIQINQLHRNGTRNATDFSFVMF